MHEIRHGFEDGKRIVMLTQYGIHMFKTNKEAQKHPAWRNAHITLNIRSLLGGLYVDTTPIYGKA